MIASYSVEEWFRIIKDAPSSTKLIELRAIDKVRDKISRSLARKRNSEIVEIEFSEAEEKLLNGLVKPSEPTITVTKSYKEWNSIGRELVKRNKVEKLREGPLVEIPNCIFDKISTLSVDEEAIPIKLLQSQGEFLDGLTESTVDKDTK